MAGGVRLHARRWQADAGRGATGRAPFLLVHGPSGFGVFPDGTELVDEYSGVRGRVRNGSVSLTTGSGLVLLGEPR